MNEGVDQPSIADFTLKVRSTINGNTKQPIFVPANKIKYLARAYLCKIEDLATEKMSNSLLDTLNLTRQRDDGEGKHIVLI